LTELFSFGVAPHFSAPPFAMKGNLPFIAIHSDNLAPRIGAT
jgi:hypothetical protein